MRINYHLKVKVIGPDAQRPAIRDNRAVIIVAFRLGKRCGPATTAC
jgi:hypothetical protein